MNHEYELPRKKLRVGVTSERGGVNAVKTLLERNSLVVQEYDTRNDYGKDLVIDLTERGEVTGGMVAAQVKGGRSFFRNGMPFIPARPHDIRLWADSSIPVVGFVWDPMTEDIFWVNLTEHCRALKLAYRKAPGRLDVPTEIQVTRRLTNDSVATLVANMRVFAKSVSSDAFLLLLDPDNEIRREGVFTCWTFGRGDPRALLLLRRVLPSMTGTSFLDALWVLNSVVGNPDIFYHAGNWIPEQVRSAVVPQLDWSPDEVRALVYEHELLDEERGGWRRGGSGQMLWHVLNPAGGTSRPDYERAFGYAVERRQLDAAFRILVALQWFARDPLGTVVDMLTKFPEMSGREDVNMLLEHIGHWGPLEPYG